MDTESDEYKQRFEAYKQAYADIEHLPHTTTFLLDLAPVEDGPEFDAWCKFHGLHSLQGGRRAWCNEFGTYFRDSVGIGTTSGGARFLVGPEELEECVK